MSTVLDALRRQVKAHHGLHDDDTLEVEYGDLCLLLELAECAVKQRETDRALGNADAAHSRAQTPHTISRYDATFNAWIDSTEATEAAAGKLTEES